jgi:hypothetical protein
VFTAAAATRLSELRAATRLHLAWCSVVDDHLALDLTAHQKKQAESKVQETSQQVDSLIGETFTQVLTPSQEPGTATIKWQTTKATAVGDVGARVSKKLATEEKLIATYGGVRVKMDVDRYELWSERGDIAVADLWSTYARYPHMPRLASFQDLAGAISDGTSNLNWSQETFAYAEAHDGETWVGVRTACHVTPAISGLVVLPDAVPTTQGGSERDEEGTGAAGDGAGVVGGRGAAGSQSGAGGVGPSDAAATRFYAQFDLDPVRGIKQLGEILEHVAARLGPNVELSLEVRAATDDGYDDATKRIVSENASNLGANGAEFE